MGEQGSSFWLSHLQTLHSTSSRPSKFRDSSFFSQILQGLESPDNVARCLVCVLLSEGAETIVGVESKLIALLNKIVSICKMKNHASAVQVAKFVLWKSQMLGMLTTVIISLEARTAYATQYFTFLNFLLEIISSNGDRKSGIVSSSVDEIHLRNLTSIASDCLRELEADHPSLLTPLCGFIWKLFPKVHPCHAQSVKLLLVTLLENGAMLLLKKQKSFPIKILGFPLALPYVTFGSRFSSDPQPGDKKGENRMRTLKLDSFFESIGSAANASSSTVSSSMMSGTLSLPLILELIAGGKFLLLEKTETTETGGDGGKTVLDLAGNLSSSAEVISFRDFVREILFSSPLLTSFTPVALSNIFPNIASLCLILGLNDPHLALAASSMHFTTSFTLSTSISSLSRLDAFPPPSPTLLPSSYSSLLQIGGGKTTFALAKRLLLSVCEPSLSSEMRIALLSFLAPLSIDRSILFDNTTLLYPTPFDPIRVSLRKIQTILVAFAPSPSPFAPPLTLIELLVCMRHFTMFPSTHPLISMFFLALRSFLNLLPELSFALLSEIFPLLWSRSELMNYFVRMMSDGVGGIALKRAVLGMVIANVGGVDNEENRRRGGGSGEPLGSGVGTTEEGEKKTGKDALLGRRLRGRMREDFDRKSSSNLNSHPNSLSRSSASSLPPLLLHSPLLIRLLSTPSLDPSPLLKLLLLYLKLGLYQEGGESSMMLWEASHRICDLLIALPPRLWETNWNVRKMGGEMLFLLVSSGGFDVRMRAELCIIMLMKGVGSWSGSGGMESGDGVSISTSTSTTTTRKTSQQPQQMRKHVRSASSSSSSSSTGGGGGGGGGRTLTPISGTIAGALGVDSISPATPHHHRHHVDGVRASHSSSSTSFSSTAGGEDLSVIVVECSRAGDGDGYGDGGSRVKNRREICIDLDIKATTNSSSSNELALPILFGNEISIASLPSHFAPSLPALIPQLRVTSSLSSSSSSNISKRTTISILPQFPLPHIVLPLSLLGTDGFGNTCKFALPTSSRLVLRFSDFISSPQSDNIGETKNLQDRFVSVVRSAMVPSETWSSSMPSPINPSSSYDGNGGGECVFVFNNVNDSVVQRLMKQRSLWSSSKLDDDEEAKLVETMEMTMEYIQRKESVFIGEQKIACFLFDIVPSFSLAIRLSWGTDESSEVAVFRIWTDCWIITAWLEDWINGCVGSVR